MSAYMAVKFNLTESQCLAGSPEPASLLYHLALHNLANMWADTPYHFEYTAGYLGPADDSELCFTSGYERNESATASFTHRSWDTHACLHEGEWAIPQPWEDADV